MPLKDRQLPPASAQLHSTPHSTLHTRHSLSSQAPRHYTAFATQYFTLGGLTPSTSNTSSTVHAVHSTTIDLYTLTHPLPLRAHTCALRTPTSIQSHHLLVVLPTATHSRTYDRRFHLCSYNPTIAPTRLLPDIHFVHSLYARPSHSAGSAQYALYLIVAATRCV